MHFHHHIRHAIGRHGGFGDGFGRRFGGRFGKRHGDDFPGGRKLNAEELQLVILALLAESPAHGYEIIRRLEERSNGFYKPSPGMVYPALTYLEEIGQTAVTQEGTRKLYTLTEEGRTHLKAHQAQAETILDLLARIGSRMADVRDAFAGLHDADPQAADSLHKARHALKSALYRLRGCTPVEARRITDILNRATAEILGKPD
ncbi:putative transcriptional regulator [Neoasaia chiangmaiensis NBRC 101099]|uniref:PadR family transcriptional regulator n=1 Tax=Neoasaia chiangmaiensis TaxID=320497 RepID=A0A1U9KQ71_9PROT|nr:PadR family transcriptional regulator [Neoasaia chiangmaiensis]AQS87936.1 PadR family transcriptional regulator [Neoasaia chiangmaiensis]GBR39022.1 putative transcriptional regulator [Neoasaia chiangmaiensis NBRC 101099]GEN15590.1 PadR family transcriptional regulator [Neoasaia chiangmaiensis]